MNTKPKLSIIIPHYNNYNGIKRLFEKSSLDNNDFIEIVIIDDYSDIEIYSNLVEFCKNKRNVKLLKNNRKKSAGSCRNIGIVEAKGDWIIFVDSDDILTKDYYKILYNYFNSNYDIIYFKVNSVFDDNLQLFSNRHLSFNSRIDNYLSYKNSYNENVLRYEWDSPWSKLINHSLITKNNITFDDTMVANDVMFSLKLGFSAKKIEATNTIFYIITDRNNSLIKQISYNSIKTRIEVNLRRKTFLLENNINIPSYQYIGWWWKSRELGFNTMLKLCKFILHFNGYKKSYFITDFIYKTIDYLKSRLNINFFRI